MSEVPASLPVILTMTNMSPQGKKLEGLVTKMGAAWEPVVQQVAEDEAVGDLGERKELVEKVVAVFKTKFFWETPALPTKVMVHNKIGTEHLTKSVKENDQMVQKPDVTAEALLEHVLEMLVVLKSDTVKRKLFAADSAQLASPVKRASLNRGLSALEMSCVRAAGDGNNNVVMETAMDYAAGEGAKLNFAEVMKRAQMHSEGGKQSAMCPGMQFQTKLFLSC